MAAYVFDYLSERSLPPSAVRLLTPLPRHFAKPRFWRSAMALARGMESLLWVVSIGCAAHATPIPTGRLDDDRLARLEAASANLERAIEVERRRQRQLALNATKRSEAPLATVPETVRRVGAVERLVVMNRPLNSEGSIARVAPALQADAQPPQAGALRNVSGEQRARRLQQNFFFPPQKTAQEISQLQMTIARVTHAKCSGFGSASTANNSSARRFPAKLQLAKPDLAAL